MSTPLPHLSRDLDAVRAAWCRALTDTDADIGLHTNDTTVGGVTVPSAGHEADDLAAVQAMSDAGLMQVTEAIARLTRDGQTVLARVAAEIAKRSPAQLGRDGLAKRRGFQNPVHLVAASTGGRAADAARLIAVGTDTAPRTTDTGEQLPPAHPHVAAGLRAGTLSLDAAAAITSMLTRVTPRALPADIDHMEKVLVERAASVPYDLLTRVIREAEARLDEAGVAPREEELRADRSLTLRTDTNGMIRLTARLDAETAAPIKAAIESIVTHTIRANRDDDTHSIRTSHEHDCDDADVPAVADTRSIPQMQADALAMIARHVLGCTSVPAAPATTLVVRTDLATLTEGVRHGTIDGLDQPVSAGTIRRMAATAGIIPLVMGTDSLPLDLGRTARGFTPAQRVALGERDGGCANCGLNIAYTEAHHIHWWKRDHGPTDLRNGVLLCPPCHARIHQDGWQITTTGNGRIWFTPPPHIDPTQTPRPGGRTRYHHPETIPA